MAYQLIWVANTCIAEGGSNRIVNIMAIDRDKQSALILHTAVRFETDALQPEVHKEKQQIYIPTNLINRLLRDGTYKYQKTLKYI